MKTNLYIILSLAACSLLASCRKADVVQRNTQNLLGDIYATKEGSGGARLFSPRYSNDTVYFDIPYFFPEDSDDETDLSRIILRSSVPSDAVVMPALGGFTDLSNPFRFAIVSGAGEKKEYVVMARKIGNVNIGKILLKYKDADGAAQEVEGVVQENGRVLFYVVPGTVMNSVVLSYDVNKHTTASIAEGAAVDLSQEQPFTLTGADGVSKTYTLIKAEPVKLDAGFGITRKLWSKTGSDMNTGGNNEVSLAVSGDHLVVTRRTNPSKYSVFNRFTGAYVREMVNPLGSQLSFQMVDDGNGHLLGASWAPKNARFILYRYKNAMDDAPVKMLDWVNNNPGGTAADGGVGRRVNVAGNLEGDAVIMATVGKTNMIYKWLVKNGAVVSAAPEVIVYNGLANGATSFEFYAEAQPLSGAPNANYWLNYKDDIALVSGTNHQRIAAFSYDTRISGNSHMPTAAVRFNNVDYLAILKMFGNDLNRAQLGIFDVSTAGKISTPFTDPAYGAFNVFNSEDLEGTANGNGTGDIAVGFSDNNERMQVYYLLTNGGVRAHEFTIYAP